MVVRTVLLASLVGYAAAACTTDNSKSVFALYQTYTVNSASDEVDVTLQGFSNGNKKIRYRVTSLPAAGTVSAPSQVYCDYQYTPKQHSALAAAALPFTADCASVSLIYKPAANSRIAKEGPVAVFSYKTEEYHADTCSDAGLVYLLNADGVLAASFFDRSADGWTVVGNGPTSGGAASYDASSRGAKLNRYIHADDKQINVAMPALVPTTTDATMWYFSAPAKFYGDQTAAYGGKLKFNLGSASGDFATVAERATLPYLVRLHCATCKISGQDSGISLAFKVSAEWDGSTTAFEVPLVESSWLKDSENSNVAWSAPTKCEMYQVLHRLSGIEILGDHLLKYESVMLDSVQLIAGPASNVQGTCYDIMHTHYN